MKDEGKVGPAVIQDHHLVNHGKLKVRVRVVDRYPGVLRQEHDEEAAQGQDGAGRRAWAAVGSEHPRQGEFTGPVGQAREGQDQRRLGEARESHFTAGAHALKARTRVQSRGDRDETAEREQVNEENRVPVKGDERRSAQGNEGRGGEDGGQRYDGTEPEHPGRGRAVDGSLAQELKRIVERLQDRRALAAGDDGFRLGDNSQHDRRREDEHHEVGRHEF